MFRRRYTTSCAASVNDAVSIGIEIERPLDGICRALEHELWPEHIRDEPHCPRLGYIARIAIMLQVELWSEIITTELQIKVLLASLECITHTPNGVERRPR